MPIAKGSKSKLLWAAESAFNVAPGGAYNGLSFRTEAMVENINKIVSDEIRSDRQVPSVRGGNIATGGNITTDFAPHRHATWLTHLLAGTMVEETVGLAAGSPEVTITALVAETVARGDYKIEEGAGTVGRIYVCTQGGVVTAGDVITGLTSTSGTEALTNTTWEYFGSLANRDADTFFRYIITPGVDYPTGGISIEKQILGQSSPLIIGFQGCRLNSLALNIPQEGIVAADWGIVGVRSVKRGATDSSSIVAVTDDPFVGYEAFLSFNGGAVGRPIREGTFNLTNNVEENVYAWGSRFRRDVPGNRREVNGNFTAYFEDHVEYDYFKNETEVSMRLSLVRQGKYFHINMGEVKLTGTGTPQIGGQGVITAQFNFDAFVQDGTSDATMLFYSMTSLVVP